jgi:hypothetical protein
MDPFYSTGAALAVTIFAVVMTVAGLRRTRRERTTELAQHTYVCTDPKAAAANLDPYSFDVV